MEPPQPTPAKGGGGGESRKSNRPDHNSKEVGPGTQGGVSLRRGPVSHSTLEGKAALILPQPLRACPWGFGRIPMRDQRKSNI